MTDMTIKGPPSALARRRPGGGTLRRLPRLRRRLSAIGVVVVVLAATGALMLLARTANDRTNTARLDQESRQIAATVSAVLPTVRSQLDDALNVMAATKSPADFARFVKRERTTEPAQFVSESVWMTTASGAELLGEVGQPLSLAQQRTATAFLRSLHPGTPLSVTGILPGSPRRLGYAASLPLDGPYVVYAEGVLPASTRFKVPKSSPFSQLNYAVYLGKSEQPANLVEASTDTPITQTHDTVAVPLGNTFVTVVVTPRVGLTPGTLEALPWVILGVGLALAFASGAVIDHLGRGRQSAEDLNARLAQLYAEQRTIAWTLQQALLPEHLPEINNVDIAARYLPGAKGTDVGGDWYDVIPLDSERFMFVIGDVSGHGIRAAAVMASLRFASRALALEGHGPAAVLKQLAKTLDFAVDGHFATVLCGLADTSRHEITFANAGHLPPLLRNNGTAKILNVPAAPPVGVMADGEDIEPMIASTPSGSLLLAYTDGLVERRGESIETSIERLCIAVEQPVSSADILLDDLLSQFIGEAGDDDVAVVALRWLPSHATEPAHEQRTLATSASSSPAPELAIPEQPTAEKAS